MRALFAAAIMLATPAQAERFTCRGDTLALSVQARDSLCSVNGKPARLLRRAPLTCALEAPARRLTVLADLRFTLEQDGSGRIIRGTCVRDL